MKLTTGSEKQLLKEIVQAFSRNTQDVIYDIQLEHGLDTGNFINGGVWDIRFNRIKLAALQNGLVVLKRKRGIWKFILLLDVETGILYVFTRDNNLNNVIKQLGKKNIHYFHAFVSLNSGPLEMDNQQLELFSMFSEEYEAKRIYEAQKILGEDYSSVKQVVFIVAKEEEKQIVSVEAHLYNRFFELLDFENLSSFISGENYSDIFVSNENPIQETPSPVIPIVKQKIKDRKNHFVPGIPSAKNKNEKTKEEKTK
jgi:hypothetical protein